MAAEISQDRAPISRAIVYALLIFGALVMLVPVLWMLSTSLKSFPETLADPPTLLPKSPRWENYPEAIRKFHFGLYLANSCIVTSATIVGTLLSACITAYAFACYNVRGQKPLFACLLATMMLPSQVTVIPLFKLFVWLHWIDTFWPLVAPSWLGTNVFAIFLLRQFFVAIPRDYIEAARLDGASELRILFTIFVPLAKPALLTIAVFTFIGSWNDLWGPLLYLHDERRFTLPLGLLQFMSESFQSTGTPWHLFMVVSTLMIIPVVAVFFLAQRQFIEGMSSVGVKG